VSTNATRGMALGLVGGMFSIGVGAGAASMGYGKRSGPPSDTAAAGLPNRPRCATTAA
jgi:hypothetical protein